MGGVVGAGGGALQAIRSRSSSAASPVGETPSVGKPSPRERSSSSADCHSFTATTPVLMADGVAKHIDQVQVGDLVANAMPGESEVSTDRVVRTIVTTADREFVDVTVRADDGAPSRPRSPPPIPTHSITSPKTRSSRRSTFGSVTNCKPSLVARQLLSRSGPITMITKYSGPAIRMDKPDHRQLYSTGSAAESRAWTAMQRELVNSGRALMNVGLARSPYK
ncbi:hypothetical protein ACWGE0_35360 [Lentzea sp. NPDC054927]